MSNKVLLICFLLLSFRSFSQSELQKVDLKDAKITWQFPGEFKTTTLKNDNNIKIINYSYHNPKETISLGVSVNTFVNKSSADIEEYIDNLKADLKENYKNFGEAKDQISSIGKNPTIKVNGFMVSSKQNPYTDFHQEYFYVKDNMFLNISITIVGSNDSVKDFNENASKILAFKSSFSNY